MLYVIQYECIILLQCHVVCICNCFLFVPYDKSYIHYVFK